MQKANGAQRFVAFLIDSILLAIVTSIVCSLIFLIFNLKSPAMITMPTDEKKDELIEYLVKETNLPRDNFEGLDDRTFVIYVAALDATKYNDSFVHEAHQWYSDYVSYSLKTSITALIVYLIFFVAYYDILGYYWSKQTIGRMLMKIKVVTDGNDKAKCSTLILRDLVGFELINILNICCCIPLIVNIVLICGKDHTSIGDKLSYTQMITYENSMKTNTDSFGNHIENEFMGSTPNNTEEQASKDESVQDAQIVSSDEENDK